MEVHLWIAKFCEASGRRAPRYQKIHLVGTFRGSVRQCPKQNNKIWVSHGRMEGSCTLVMLCDFTIEIEVV